MNLPVRKARLIQGRSDKRDEHDLANAMRDAIHATPRFGTGIKTSDATVTELWRDEVNGDSSIILHIDVTATSGTDFAAYSRRIVAHRDGAFGVSIDVTDTIGTDFETNAAWDISITADAGDLVLSVTGAAATDVKWRAAISATWSPFE